MHVLDDPVKLRRSVPEPDPDGLELLIAALVGGLGPLSFLVGRQRRATAAARALAPRAGSPRAAPAAPSGARAAWPPCPLAPPWAASAALPASMAASCSPAFPADGSAPAAPAPGGPASSWAALA